MAPVVWELARRKTLESKVVVTAQHREMLDQVMDTFSLKADYDLDLMTPNQTLAFLTARILGGVEDVLYKEEPDLVLVQGDTTTVMVTALAAFHNQIPVGHVEAGLRTHNIYNPFPEEMNRRITDTLSSLYFAPTELARSNLLREGVDEKKIHLTGNTVIDALLWVAGQKHEVSNQQLRTILDNKSRKVLLTAHRRENYLSKGMKQIYEAVREILANFDDVEIIFPVHPNPNVRKMAYEQLGNHPRVHLIEPLNYKDMVRVMKESYLVLTDSGGIQEEAPSLGKPVVVLRETTERPEGIEAGTAVLAGTKKEKIVKITGTLLSDEAAYQRMAKAVNPYGDGTAAKKIVDIVVKFCDEQHKKIS